MFRACRPWRSRAGCAALGAALVVAACSKAQEHQAVDTIRAVKVQVVHSERNAQTREFVGEVRPVRFWTLGFQVSGRVADVLVKAGDQVHKGEILAHLDPSSYKLKLESAEANLKAATTDVGTKQQRLDAQNDLKAKGFGNLRSLDTAQSDLSAAQAEVAARKVTRDLAQRDLDNTVLTAPDDGVVAQRSVEPFTDVESGKTVLRIDSTTRLQVAVRVPESLIHQTQVGHKVAISINGLPYTGVVTEVGAQVEAGNAFEVIVGIDGINPVLRSGMTARVTFNYPPSGHNLDAMVVPLRAILPGDKPMQGYVFVYDPAEHIVHKVPIQATDLQNNLVEVTGGLKDGQAIVVAGVAFLSDKQKVVVFNPNELKTASAPLPTGPTR
jgi:membrane fusion protein, multidrug efflux system